MKQPARITLGALLALVAAGCDGESAPTAPGADAAPALAVFGGDWSEPVLLDAAVNSPFRELSPRLSPDKLSLYFNTDVPVEGLPDLNIWVARRPCLDCPFEPARLLPPPVNGPDHAGVASLSHDGHILFWSSNREGSAPLADGSGPSQDIWMATRKDPKDDFGWEDPRRLVSPPECEGEARVNTEAFESPGSYVAVAPGAPAELYFGRQEDLRIFRVAIGRWGEVLGCAEPIPELAPPVRSPTVRADGLELVFWAPGAVGASDVWSSTRRSVNEAWSAPENLGPPVNSPFADLAPGLSHDGTTLVFASGPARGGLGFQDIWISTRARGM
jgi:hypothetical protein